MMKDKKRNMWILTLTIHRHVVGHQCQDPTRLKIAHFEMQQHELAVVGSGAAMNWAKCAWEEKFLDPMPLLETIVMGGSALDHFEPSNPGRRQSPQASGRSIIQCYVCSPAHTSTHLHSLYFVLVVFKQGIA